MANFVFEPQYNLSAPGQGYAGQHFEAEQHDVL